MNVNAANEDMLSESELKKTTTRRRGREKEGVKGWRIKGDGQKLGSE